MKQISIWLIFFFFFAGFSVVRPILVKRESKPVIQSSTLNVIGVIQKVHVYVRIVIRMEQLHLRVIGCVTYKALGLTSSQLATLAKDVWLGLIRESAGCPKADSVKWAGLRWKIFFFFFAVLKWQLRERRAAREREKLQSLTAWNKSCRLEVDEGEERGDDRGCQWPPAAEQWHWWNKAGSREQCCCRASLAARPTTRADRCCSCFEWSFSCHQILTNYTMQSSISNVN